MLPSRATGKNLETLGSTNCCSYSLSPGMSYQLVVCGCSSISTRIRNFVAKKRCLRVAIPACLVHFLSCRNIKAKRAPIVFDALGGDVAVDDDVGDVADVTFVLKSFC